MDTGDMDWVIDEGLSEDGREALAELKELMPRYLSEESAEERASLSARITARFYILYAAVVPRTCRGTPDLRDLALVRCAAPVPELLGEELREAVRGICEEKQVDKPVYYADEWFFGILRQRIAPSATDETEGPSRTTSTQGAAGRLRKVEGQITVAKGQLEGAGTRLSELDSQVLTAAQQLVESGQQLWRVALASMGKPEVAQNMAQALLGRRRQLMADLRKALDEVLPSDRALGEAHEAHLRVRAERERLRDEVRHEGGDTAAVSASAVDAELRTYRQMVKLAIGRRGNHFPVASQSFLRGPVSGSLNNRQKVLETMAQAERLDAGLYMRSSHGQEIRVEPFVVILPCAGNMGICWEAWGGGNRRLQGRIAVPLYCAKSENDLALRALGAFRWMVAKETAMHRWMEEGLTGAYYQLKEKTAGSHVDEAFAHDYVVWMTKEACGRATLDPKTRALFWRFVPFSEEVKRGLKDHGAFRPLFDADRRRSQSRFTSMP